MAGVVRGADSPPDDLIELGQVAAAHGVRGGLKIRSYSPEGSVLLASRCWWLRRAVSGLGRPDANPPLRPYRVLSCKRQGQGRLLAQLEGVEDRDAADALRGATLLVSRETFPPPDPGEAYWVDLIGCDFYGLDGAHCVVLGRVDQVLDNGEHALLQLNRGAYDGSGLWVPQHDARGRPEQFLVPFVAAHILRMDLESRRIFSNWPAAF